MLQTLTSTQMLAVSTDRLTLRESGSFQKRILRKCAMCCKKLAGNKQRKEQRRKWNISQVSQRWQRSITDLSHKQGCGGRFLGKSQSQLKGKKEVTWKQHAKISSKCAQ